MVIYLCVTEQWSSNKTQENTVKGLIGAYSTSKRLIALKSEIHASFGMISHFFLFSLYIPPEADTSPQLKCLCGPWSWQYFHKSSRVRKIKCLSNIPQQTLSGHLIGISDAYRLCIETPILAKILSWTLSTKIEWHIPLVNGQADLAPCQMELLPFWRMSLSFHIPSLLLTVTHMHHSKYRGCWWKLAFGWNQQICLSFDLCLCLLKYGIDWWPSHGMEVT